jgi:hypothetical protein
MKSLTTLVGAAALVTAAPASAIDYSVVGLGFEGLQVLTLDASDPLFGTYDPAQVWNYYNGGYSRTSDGSANLVLGPNNYNVAFNSTAKALMSFGQAPQQPPIEIYGTGNFGPRYLDVKPPDPSNPPSTGPGSVLSDVGISALRFDTSTEAPLLNFASGFNNGFSFYYASTVPVTITLFDGVDGTGSTLGGDTFKVTPLCSLNDNSFCAWSVGTIAINGTAKSVRFDGLDGRTLFDNVTFGSVTPIDGAIPVPEPGTYALMVLGLASVGWVARRRRLRP